jgi:hypothetical protein
MVFESLKNVVEGAYGKLRVVYRNLRGTPERYKDDTVSVLVEKIVELSRELEGCRRELEMYKAAGIAVKRDESWKKNLDEYLSE